MRTNEDGSSVLHTTTTRKHGGFLAWGGYQEKVSCKCILSEGEASQEVRNFEVKVELSEKNASKDDFANHFMERLKTTLDLDLGSIENFPDIDHDRTVVLTMQLTQDDIRNLDTISPEMLQAIPPLIADLIRDFHALPSGEPQAQRIGAFLKQYEMEGMAILKLLFRKSNEEIEVESTNGLLTELQKSVDTSLTRYEGTPLAADMSKKELTMRYEDLSEAAKNVRTMVQSVKADPFMKEDERATRVNQLATMLNALQKAFNPGDLSPGERDEFAQQLDAGWTTDLQYEMIEMLLMRDA